MRDARFALGILLIACLIGGLWAALAAFTGEVVPEVRPTVQAPPEALEPHQMPPEATVSPGDPPGPTPRELELQRQVATLEDRLAVMANQLAYLQAELDKRKAWAEVLDRREDDHPHLGWSLFKQFQVRHAIEKLERELHSQPQELPEGTSVQEALMHFASSHQLGEERLAARVRELFTEEEREAIVEATNLAARDSNPEHLPFNRADPLGYRLWVLLANPRRMPPPTLSNQGDHK